MKKLSFEEFVKMPEGTIFYPYKDGEYFAAELHRKGQNCFYENEVTDFFQEYLFPRSDELDDSKISYASARWALYDYEMEFIVLEHGDIDGLIQALGG
jgi:hypothetical protein